MNKTFSYGWTRVER